MEIAIIKDGTIDKIGLFRDLFPNTSFTSDGPSDEFLAENNAKKVNRFKSHNKLTQCLFDSTPYIEGDWVYTVDVRDLTTEEIQAHQESAFQQIRANRNQLLSTCDWTQISDVPEAIKLEWLPYRALLRDLPSTISEPRTFTAWPKRPGELELPITT
jgi:hypothetical protein